jgi:hypothetical protein
MRTRVAPLFAAALIALFMAACDSTASIKLPAPMSTTPASPTAVATMPALTAERGWHIVLTLGNTSATSQTFAGSFVATKTYKLFYTCKGSGTLHIT